MNYPSWSHSDELLGSAGGATPVPRTATQTLSVDPRRSMRAATAELETALEGLGADMSPATRRRTALLASELIAQVAGRDLDHGTEIVDLTAVFSPGGVRLETGGLSRSSINGGFGPEGANVLAEWGEFLLNRLADRWGIGGTDQPVLWAEVDLARGQAVGR
jgi:hypothetical protein